MPDGQLPRARQRRARVKGVAPLQPAVECSRGNGAYHSEGALQVHTLMFDALLRLSYGRFNLTDARVLLLDGPSFRLATTAISVGVQPWNVHIAINQAHNIAEQHKSATEKALLGRGMTLLQKNVGAHLREDPVCSGYNLIFLGYNCGSSREKDVGLLFERGWFATAGCVLACTCLSNSLHTTQGGSLGTTGVFRHTQQLAAIAGRKVGRHDFRLEFLSHDKGLRVASAHDCCQGTYQGSSAHSIMWFSIHVFVAHRDLMSMFRDLGERSADDAMRKRDAVRQALELQRDLERTLHAGRPQGSMKRPRGDALSLAELMGDSPAARPDVLSGLFTPKPVRVTHAGG